MALVDKTAESAEAGQDKPICEASEAEAPSQVFGGLVPNLDLQLWDLLCQSATAYPDREALVSLWQGAGHAGSNEGSSLKWSYGCLLERCKHLAAALARRLQSQRTAGASLAMVSGNSAEWALCLWTAARMGMPFAPLDARASAADVADMLDVVRPCVLVVQEASWARDLAAWSHGIVRIQCSRGERVAGWERLDDLQDEEEQHQDEQHQDEQHQDEQHGLEPRLCRAPATTTALILFTSGTSGRPKACPHSHANVVAQTHVYDANEHVDRWLVHTPASHMFALNNALRAWRQGHVVVLPSANFDVSATADALERQCCTVVSATPTLVRALLAHWQQKPHGRRPGADQPAKAVSVVTVAGTSVSPSDLLLCRRVLGARDAIQAYGLSEGGPLISWARNDGLLKHGLHAGVGKLLPGAAARICPPRSTSPLPRGHVGELHVGGPSVIAGYLGAGQQQQAFYRDHHGTWLVTGDQARMDKDGVVFILGRYDDLIIRGGENIWPAAIEAALTEVFMYPPVPTHY
ncbi:hypothetical protein CDD81_6960 [Ophiocordyceps australis]|uniref:AMP-dependent synthetase/ligase domain-containing protein n=1 Tax=Ophiocordyceps australis TaxID=1399860 RepID=A0A2C5YAF9_9HYPO|nr:hypothetical protein CDD81_6960 [Ophiocordyceps australis]